MIPIKNAREIEKMRQACRTASDILDRVSDLIRPGITTKEVDQAAADFMSDAGNLFAEFSTALLRGLIRDEAVRTDSPLGLDLAAGAQ